MPTKQLLGIDWAWGRPRAKHLVDAGYRLACRYLSNDPSKNLDAAERDGLLKAGMDIVVVWESTAGRALQGAGAGREDAHRAVLQLRKLRGPEGMTVFFAVDTATTGEKVTPYFQAARAVVHAAGYRIGVYGSYSVVNSLHAAGLVDHVWQTVAWSFGKVSKHADLYQRAQTRKIDGVTVDVDVICHPGDYGGWQAALSDRHPAKKKHVKRQHAAAKKNAEQAAKPKKRGHRIRIAVTKAWLVDTLERSLSTFVEYFAGTFGFQGLVALSKGDWHQALSLAHIAGSAGMAAAAAVVKAAFAAKKNRTVSPASLAPAEQPGRHAPAAPPA